MYSSVVRTLDTLLGQLTNGSVAVSKPNSTLLLVFEWFFIKTLDDQLSSVVSDYRNDDNCH